MTDDSITIIHWYGKLLSVLMGQCNRDKNSILTSYKYRKQLLDVSTLDIGTKVDRYNEIFQTLEDWCVADRITLHIIFLKRVEGALAISLEGNNLCWCIYHIYIYIRIQYSYIIYIILVYFNLITKSNILKLKI